MPPFHIPTVSSAPDINELDTDKLAEVALGLLALTLHDGCRAWKNIDWDVLDLLYQRGFILDPRDRNKSVVLTEAGLAQAGALLMKHFGHSLP